MTTTNDPHAREYAAAVAGMNDHTISPPVTRIIEGQIVDTYAVGDRIKWLEKGHELYGVVVEVLTPTTYHVRRHVPDIGNQHHAVDAEQILPW